MTLCNAHYLRQWRGNSLTDRTLAERFWEKVDKRGPVLRPGIGRCWVWTASLDRNEYGQFGVGGRSGRPHRAHRIAWWLSTGEWLPPEVKVCHHCDNPPCVRPAHLFKGSQAQNLNDMTRKGRRKNQFS